MSRDRGSKWEGKGRERKEFGKEVGRREKRMHRRVVHQQEIEMKTHKVLIILKLRSEIFRKISQTSRNTILYEKADRLSTEDLD